MKSVKLRNELKKLRHLSWAWLAQYSRIRHSTVPQIVIRPKMGKHLAHPLSLYLHQTALEMRRRHIENSI